MNQALRWMAAGLAVVAVFFLPALRASVPLLPAAEWTTAALGGEVFHAVSHNVFHQAAPGEQPNLNRILRQAQSLRAQWGGGSSRPSARLGFALGLAALIPGMAIMAGACGLLSLVFIGWRRRRGLAVVAAIGCVATAYAAGASWWLTRVAQSELTQMLQGAQHRWGGGLLGAVNWRSLQAGIGAVRLAPEVGLYLLLLSFLTMLMLPLEVG